MKIAQYKDIKHNYISVNLVEDWIENSESYIRVSKVVDVEFEKISDSEAIEKELAGLARVEQALREQFQEKLDDITERRQKLLSLPNLSI